MKDDKGNPSNVGGQGIDQVLLLHTCTPRQRLKAASNPFCAATRALNLANKNGGFSSYRSKFHEGSDGVNRRKLVKRDATDRLDPILQSANLSVALIRRVAVCWIGSVLISGLHSEFDLITDLKNIQQKALFIVRSLLAFMPAIFFSLPPSNANSRANCQDRTNGLNPCCNDLLKCCGIVFHKSPPKF